MPLSSNPLLRKSTWLMLYVVISLLSILPFVAELPLPEQTTKLDEAMFIDDELNRQTVALPHRWRKQDASQNQANYLLAFDLQELPAEPLYIFIPNLKRHMQASLNGEFFFDSSNRVSWAGPLMQITGLGLLPSQQLRKGSNQLTITLQTAHPLPSQLSEIYLGTKAEIVPYFKQRVWVNERLLAMSYAVQLLLTVGLLAAYSFRPQDTIFAWLGLTVGLSSTFGAGLLVDVIPSMISLYPFVFLLGPSIGIGSILFALSLNRLNEPSYLKITLFISPAILYAITLITNITIPQIAVAIAIPSLIIGFIVATGIIAVQAIRWRRIESRLILGPWFLIAVYMVHDLVMSIGLVSGTSFTNHSVRTLIIVFIVIILMQRLSSSLNTIDRNEEVLHHRLEEQKNTMGETFAKQSVAIKQSTIETERQRLISDLHDGMGGHLVSILALAENPQTDKSEVQQVAQKALNDLRMVIYSLDIDGGDLSYALALYRQQIDPVLNNLGIETRWSLLNLPEISETGPSNVLSVLRILQEALTNAQKHGIPKLITIIGQAGPDNSAELVIENTGGTPYKAGNAKGYGLNNMHKRARALNGRIDLEALPDGARFTLQLPLDLPLANLEP